MAVPMADVMRACRNFFDAGYRDAAYTIADDIISPHDMLTAGGIIAVTGSMQNDGVYTVGEDFKLTGVTPEQFNGRIWLLRPPKDFVSLCSEIAEYALKNAPSAVVSESFGNYSHANATGQNGAVVGWETVYAERLAPYRRMFKGVPL